jgi:hypothetical protein
MGRYKNSIISTLSSSNKKKIDESSDTDTLVEEDVSIRLPLSQKDLKSLNLKKTKKKTNKKLLKVPSFSTKNSTESEDSDNSSESSESEDSDSDSNTKKKVNKHNSCKKLCEGCISRDQKIKEMKALIKELTDNVKTTNGIDLKERKTLMSKMNFVEFTKDGKTWTPTTEIYCMWDMHPFKSIPIGIPHKYVKGKFKVFGCFCSFNCALAFLLKLDGYDVWHRYSLLHKLYRKIYGIDKVIKVADSIMTIVKWGGHKTIEEYRRDNLICEKESRIIIPPMSSIVPLIEYDYDDDNKINSANVALAKTNKRVRLKRRKPLTNQTGLLKCMGLKIKSKTV